MLIQFRRKIHVGFNEAKMKEIYAVLQGLEVEFMRSYDNKHGFYFIIGKQFHKPPTEYYCDPKF